MELYSFDEGYVQRLRNDDPETQRHFVKYFSELLLIKLRSRQLPKDVIDDLRQETFVRVLAILKRERGLENPERLGPFVNSVCNNVLLEQYRTKARTGSLEDEAEPQDKSVDLDRQLISDEAKRTVDQVLSGMAERDRRVLKAIFLQEEQKDKVCADFGVDRDYLRVLLHRAKLQFKEKMGEVGLSRTLVPK